MRKTMLAALLCLTGCRHSYYAQATPKPMVTLEEVSLGHGFYRVWATGNDLATEALVLRQFRGYAARLCAADGFPYFTANFDSKAEEKQGATVVESSGGTFNNFGPRSAVGIGRQTVVAVPGQKWATFAIVGDVKCTEQEQEVWMREATLQPIRSTSGSISNDDAPAALRREEPRDRPIH